MSRKHRRNEDFEDNFDSEDIANEELSEDVGEELSEEELRELGEEVASESEVCEENHEEINDNSQEENQSEFRDEPQEENQRNSDETHEENHESGREPFNDYLNMARQLQADFDNYRRRTENDIKQAKINGQVSVIEVFLPCLDTFKEAKKNISDENVLKGVEMIENKIIETLTSLGVEKIDSIGQVYDPHVHNVIAVMCDQEKDNDIILDEFQAGYKFNDKVIRYSKVIVNKKED